MKCLKCDRSWVGLRMCHCAGCCRHFSTVRAFDAHQPAKNDFECQDPPSEWFSQGEDGVWRWSKTIRGTTSKALSAERGMVA